MFIVVDNLSNYAYLSTSQIGIAHIFFYQDFCLHEMPRPIICDRDSSLTSLF